ncbi:uncharacterized protein LOC112574059 [Pomacea canaliculata]|uniref:uncharacterized protein LOC112574059 n=1 Tax=Pomacea canaliculata TaxID=400727 RepID=UPI000D7348FA|nr:uncharacterized protein LOC112574059 [Pomacea canaliculata]
MRPMSAPTRIRGPPLSLCDIMRLGYLQQVRMLVELGADMEVKDASGRTPLMLTAYVQPEDWGVGVARLLIESGVNMAARDRHGMNVLHHACVYERLELAKVLLSALDFDMTQSDKSGNTALHYAAIAGNVRLVQLLLDYLARYRLPAEKINKQGRSPLDEAILSGSAQCATLLSDVVSRSQAIRGDASSQQTTADASSRGTSGIQHASVSVIDEGVGWGGCTEDNWVEGSVFSYKSDYSPDQSEREYPQFQNENASPTKARRSGVRRPHTATTKGCLPGGSDVGSSRSPGTTNRLQRSSSLLSLRGNVVETTRVSFHGVKDGSTLDARGSSSIISTKTPIPSARSLRTLQRERTVISRGKVSPPNEKNPDLVIHVVPESDFRNAPEYVLKLTRMPSDPLASDRESLPSLVHKHQLLLPYQEQASKKLGPGTWREEMQVLYRHYEIQCSPNWRNAARQVLDSAFNQDDGDDIGSKERKLRRPSPINRQLLGADISTSSMSVKRRPGSNKQRKISASSPPAASDQVSSSESVVSNSSLRKKDSTGSRTEAGSVPGAGDGGANSGASRSLAKVSVESSGGSGGVAEMNGGSGAAGRGEGGFAQGVTSSAYSTAASMGGGGRRDAGRRARRVGTVNSQDVPTLTETLITDDVGAEALNSESVEIDSNRLTVLSDIDED